LTEKEREETNQIIVVLFVEFDLVCQFDLHDGVHFGLLK
jgi:hypothetical protein